MAFRKEDIKKLKLKECILQSIDLYLLENSEKYGFVYVENIILTNDLRRAKVYLKTHEKTENSAFILNEIGKESAEIFRVLKERFEVKYYPSLEFELINE